MSVEASSLITRYPDISSPDIYILPKEERPCGGVVEYTTLPQAIVEYQKDPYGERALKFLQDAFGIADPELFLEDAGLGRYLDAKRKGSMVSAVKAHFLTATPYNFTDVLMSGNIAKMHGIPTACVAMGYEDDIFHTSEEKMEAFGPQQYFVGYGEQRGNKKRKSQFAQINIKAIGVRDDSDDGMRPVSVIDEAQGEQLKNIFVAITDPIDPRGSVASKNTGGKTTDYIESILGMTWGEILNNPYSNSKNPGRITVTQLHKVFFGKTVDRLRTQGYLPEEEEMPIIYAELGNLSKALLKHSNKVDSTLEILGFKGKPQDLLSDVFFTTPHVIKAIQQHLRGEVEDDTSIQSIIAGHHEQLSEDEREFIHNLPDSEAQESLEYVMQAQGLFFDEKTGLLCRNTPEGPMADPASYYPVFSALLDNDHASLDETSIYFTSKIQRCQQLFRAHDLPVRVIRTPHTEIAEIDSIRIHPTGVFYDVKQMEIEIYQTIIADFQKGLNILVDGALPVTNGKPVKPTKGTKDAVSTLMRQVTDEHFHRALAGIRESAMNNKPHEKAVITDALVTDEVLGWWIQMLLSTQEGQEKEAQQV